MTTSFSTSHKTSHSLELVVPVSLPSTGLSLNILLYRYPDQAFFIYHVVLPLIFLQVQALRRLLESLFLTVVATDRRMHITHYDIGVAFYRCASLTIVAQDGHLASSGSYEPQSAQSKHSVDFSIDFSIFWHFLMFLLFLSTVVCGVLLFAFASWHQFSCHHILARLRSPHRTTDVSMKASPGQNERLSEIYSIPRLSLFI
jgi:hypothetical protein